MKKPPDTSTIPDGITVPVYHTAFFRYEQSWPTSFRLAKKIDGTMILQGAYLWQDENGAGHTWKDIPTVELTE